MPPGKGQKATPPLPPLPSPYPVPPLDKDMTVMLMLTYDLNTTYCKWFLNESHLILLQKSDPI